MADEVKRFQRVLRVREVEREITQGELAEKLREEETIVEKLIAAESQRDAALESFCSEREELLSPQQLWFERQSLDVMERSLDEDRQELEVCRERIEETKVELLEKHRNVQMMEKYVCRLRDRRTKKELAAEQSNLDDITTMRYSRGLGGGSDV
jgi:Flagellar biosynthesis chaperone